MLNDGNKRLKNQMMAIGKKCDELQIFDITEMRQGIWT